MTRDDLAEQYLGQLPYTPYPVQEDALLAWFTSEQGVLVCAPTGTGKTLIAQAALFEALHTGTTAYYTTPLIALTEQKFREMQASAVRWGFREDDVGLVTGNRRVNPDASILVVVAEILLNRLLHPAAFDFTKVSAVVMDEFHSFADPERGIVWELSLSLLPAQARLLLLSATVGNSLEFLQWLERCHQRKLELVESKDRKIPLTYVWVADQFLTEQVVLMTKGDGDARKVPALLFCFNRDECWSVAEQLKGLPLLQESQKAALHAEINKLDWTQGVGPKIKQMLHRGVGVHHAGLLPKYRRVVEELFHRKLLAVVICTETLASGINLPARSVILSSLVKGPMERQKLIDASTAQQIFGRAGRPQFDDRGYVYAVAHEDDVKIHRWKEKNDQIPDDTRDPGLLKAKKDLKRKKPTRSDTRTYWTENQFKQLQAAPPGKLYSKGPLPWRLLAYLLKVSPEVSLIRTVIRKRLMDEARVKAQDAQLDRMLITLANAGYVTLTPEPPKDVEHHSNGVGEAPATRSESHPTKTEQMLAKALGISTQPQTVERYQVTQATPTEKLDQLLVFRSVHPLYAAFLLQHLGIADRNERLQIFESVLEMPRSVLRYVRVPFPEDLPPGPLTTTRLDADLIARGLMIAKPTPEEGEEDDDGWTPSWEEREQRAPTLAEKLRLLFDATYPEVADVTTQSVWAAAELLRFDGNFNKYVQSRDLVKQEGIVFRHLLRLILMLGEFSQVTPEGIDSVEWQAELRDIVEQLTASCRAIDPASTDEAMAQVHAADVVEGEHVLPPGT
ncbi:MAG: DEAD/DEAH box helicase [Planctomycetes bacterium]|nr:DEAD/DEAH box helicase [Planctomycetota bacterium]